MIKVDREQITIKGDYRLIMNELSMIVHGIVKMAKKSLSDKEMEYLIEDIKDSVEIGLMLEEELRVRANKILDEMSEEERLEFLKTMIMKGE